MKFTKLFRILTLALFIILLVSTLPASPALAAGNLFTTPESGKIGDELELYGSGFDLVTQYDLYFSRDRASTNDEIDQEVINYQFLDTITTNNNGTFFDQFYDVPSSLRHGDEIEKVRGGTYYIYATQRNDEIIQSRIDFEVDFSPSISLDPEQGAVASEIEITGEGYADSEDINIEYDGASLDIASGDQDTDSSGEFVCTVQIPEGTAGEHTITVTGDDSSAEATAEFTVEAAITSSPESGVGGTSITVSGTGFKGSATVTLSFDSGVTTPLTTNSKGSFSTSITAPTSKAAGSYTIAADDGTNLDEASFAVTDTSLAIDPTSGEMGDEV
ncbi:hypothetical protein ACFLVJ_02915, partial [Chloroflexota bacterium]